MSDEEAKKVEEPKVEEKPAEIKAEETSKKITRNLDAIVEELGQLTVMEAADLAKKLAKAWDLDLDALTSAPTAQAGATAPAEESATVTIVLKEFKEGAKINVLKAVKVILGIGLMESKNFIEDLPKEINQEVPRDKAEKIKKQLEDAGGTVEFK